MQTWFFHLQTVHSSLSTSFLVVLAFFLRMGLDWPPKPCCLRSYLGSNSNGEEEVNQDQDTPWPLLLLPRVVQRHHTASRRRHDPRVTGLRDKWGKMICDRWQGAQLHTCVCPGPAWTRRTSYTASPWTSCARCTARSRCYGPWACSPSWGWGGGFWKLSNSKLFFNIKICHLPSSIYTLIGTFNSSQKWPSRVIRKICHFHPEQTFQ